MAVREILQLGNPLLWEKSIPVGDGDDDKTKELTRDLRDTLMAFRETNGFGLGIAAPQIGVLQRVIYISMPDGDFEGLLINPDIVRASFNRVEIWDACFSLPGLMVKVLRSAEVEVEYTDVTGNQRRIKADGDLAELLQHEIDHLNGILMLSRAVSFHAFSTREEWIHKGRPK